MKILFRSHSIEKNIARNANAVPCCSLLKDDNERWNSSVRNVMSVSIILSSYHHMALKKTLMSEVSLAPFLHFIAAFFILPVFWTWDLWQSGGIEIVEVDLTCCLWFEGRPPNPSGDYTHRHQSWSFIIFNPINILILIIIWSEPPIRLPNRRTTKLDIKVFFGQRDIHIPDRNIIIIILIWGLSTLKGDNSGSLHTVHIYCWNKLTWIHRIDSLFWKMLLTSV